MPWGNVGAIMLSGKIELQNCMYNRIPIWMREREREGGWEGGREGIRMRMRENESW
jgi:hypothetical protein